MARVSVLLIVVALIAGMVGCEAAPAKQYDLTIASTEGGKVTFPGGGTFTYDEGEVVELVAEAEEDYRFVTWMGDMAAIADIDGAITTITMNADYSIMACFALKPTGAFLDEIVITRQPDSSAAVQQLKEDALDVYAFGLDDPALYAEVLSDPSLTSAESFRNCNEFTFNPVGPTFPQTGKLNPFSVPMFREAMHWLIDRGYIAREICGGLAMPRYTCLDSAGADATERYPDLIAALEAKYAHDPDKAEAVITEEMERLGAVLEGGMWRYNGEPVELIFLIRTEDERKEMGDYFANLLEGEGFTVTRHYGTQADLAPLWRGDPARGVFHIYTGGWGNAVIAREEGQNFGSFYTNLWSEMGPLWQAYENDPVFYEAAERLWNYDYASMEERAELFEICLPMSMEDSVRMFLITNKRFSPMRDSVCLAADAVGGVSGGISMWRYTGSNATYTPGGSGSWMWALTAHFVDDEGEPIVGGTLRVAMPDVFTNPWNPVSGSNVAYDTFPIRATGDRGLQPDTRTGLRWPARLEKAEVFVQNGLPMGVTNTEWCSIEFISEIQVPLDAWADWDATEQRFITAQERFGPGGATALVKSVSYYPKDIFQVPLHDGSTLSMGDFILYAILQFDRGKEASAIYDESYAGQLDSFMETFKGVKFITDDPDYGLIVEYYSDMEDAGSYSVWDVDAELAVMTMFPVYPGIPFDSYNPPYCPGVWHTITLGIRAEEDRVLAFSQSKSSTLGVEWMSFIDGPSLPLLRSYLTRAKAINYIPYEPTMGLYVTEAEAAQRWSNLEDWYSDKGHFWVGSGPFYLQSADTTEKVVRLKRFEDYPDPMDRWLFLLEPLP